MEQAKCLKCGRETDQSFCEECRAVMKRYPVKPETAVNLPQRSQIEKYRRKPRHRAQITPEEQILRLKRKVRRLLIWILVLILLICAMSAAGYYFYRHRKTPQVGQNYTVSQTATEPNKEN